MKNPLTIAAFALAAAIQVNAVAAEEVEIEHNGLTLNANLEKADASWPDGPVVLMTHGTLGHRGLEIIEGLQGLLAERGISSVGINLGLAIDDRAAAMYECKTPHRHLHTDAVGEIGAWLNWLKAQGTKKVVLLGHSRGGNQTARFAADRPDSTLVAVTLIAPQTWSEAEASQDYQKRYGERFEPLLKDAQALVADGEGGTALSNVDFIYCEDTEVSAEAFASYYTPDVKMDTPQLIPRIQAPVLVIAGSEDSTVQGLAEKVEPLADGERIRLMTIEGADHFFRDLYAEDIADAVAEQIGTD